MPRRPRYLPAGIPAHLLQRGNDRQSIFRSDTDRAVYLKYLGDSLTKFDVQVHSWVLMTNHVHMLATPGTDRAISGLMQHMGRMYVRYFNQKHERTGTLFEDRFKSQVVQTERYFFNCSCYIELNPVRAGMVCSPIEHRWSSFGVNAFGMASMICSPHAEYLKLGTTPSERQHAYQALFQGRNIEIELIRHSINRGYALGDEVFKNRIEKESGLPQTKRKRGPRKSRTTVLL